MDVIPVIVNIVVKVLLINLREEMSEMSSKENPVRVKKKIRERRVENYRHQRQKIMANAIS